jgi:hypothetical protein
LLLVEAFCRSSLDSEFPETWWGGLEMVRGLEEEGGTRALANRDHRIRGRRGKEDHEGRRRGRRDLPQVFLFLCL